MESAQLLPPLLTAAKSEVFLSLLARFSATHSYRHSRVLTYRRMNEVQTGLA